MPDMAALLNSSLVIYGVLGGLWPDALCLVRQRNRRRVPGLCAQWFVPAQRGVDRAVGRSRCGGPGSRLCRTGTGIWLRRARALRAIAPTPHAGRTPPVVGRVTACLVGIAPHRACGGLADPQLAD